MMQYVPVELDGRQKRWYFCTYDEIESENKQKMSMWIWYQDLYDAI